MLDKFRTRWAKHRFNAQISGVLHTPPIRVEPADFTIFSMVANDDVPMYLVAIKSFYARIGCGKVAAIIDRDMPGELRDILQRHVPGIRFVILEDIDTGPCQRGGTWERVLHLLDHAREEYAIQLDADTLTTGPMDEVLACVSANRAFTLGTWEGERIVPVSEASAYAERLDYDHIILLTERALSRLPDAATLKYVRGSSGFAGFARGGFDRRRAEDFHVAMAELLGSRFREWGTEQVASNFAVANSPDPLVLPFPDYTIFEPKTDVEKARFFHFIGTFRYRDGIYAQLSRRFIASAVTG